MYRNEIYYTVSESNIGANDVINIANYTFTDKNKAYSKLYRLWGYGASPDANETRQLLSAYMTEHQSDRVIMLESRVFDYRAMPTPPEPEEDNGETEIIT